MEGFNLFQDRIEGESPQIHKIEHDFEKMNEYLDEYVTDCEIREDLYDQLSWLKFQIDYTKSGNDPQMLIDNYNWVIANFNNDLALNDEELFLFLYQDDPIE